MGRNTKTLFFFSGSTYGTSFLDSNCGKFLTTPFSIENTASIFLLYPLVLNGVSRLDIAFLKLGSSTI